MTRRTRHAALRRPGRRRRRRNPTSSHWGVAAVHHSVPQCGVAASTCSTGPRAPRAGVDSRRGLARVGLLAPTHCSPNTSRLRPVPRYGASQHRVGGRHMRSLLHALQPFSGSSPSSPAPMYPNSAERARRVSAAACDPSIPPPFLLRSGVHRKESFRHGTGSCTLLLCCSRRRHGCACVRADRRK